MRPVDRLKELKSYADPILARVYDTEHELPQLDVTEMMCLNNYIDVLRQLGPDFIRVWEILMDGKQDCTATDVNNQVELLNIALSDLNEQGKMIML